VACQGRARLEAAWPGAGRAGSSRLAAAAPALACRKRRRFKVDKAVLQRARRELGPRSRLTGGMLGVQYTASANAPPGTPCAEHRPPGARELLTGMLGHVTIL